MRNRNDYTALVKAHKEHVSCGNKSCSISCHDTDAVCCYICNKWYHKTKKCTKKNKKFFQELGDDPFICDHKCYLSLLPFFYCDEIDFSCFLYGDLVNGLYPCIKCKRDCLDDMNCLQCDGCDKWTHLECTHYDIDDFYSILDYGDDFYCSEKCVMQVLPFSKCKYGNLLKDQIFVISRKCSSKSTSKSQKIETSKKNKKIPTEFVKLDHFQKINCDYLKPNKLNDSAFETDSGLSVFHTNVRSLPKHFDDLNDVFGNCKTMPAFPFPIRHHDIRQNHSRF